MAHGSRMANYPPGLRLPHILLLMCLAKTSNLARSGQNHHLEDSFLLFYPTTRPVVLHSMVYYRFIKTYMQNASRSRSSENVMPPTPHCFHSSLPILRISLPSTIQYFDGALPSVAVRAATTAALPM